jgi:polar amino acid transport system ATP-binding protein
MRAGGDLPMRDAELARMRTRMGTVFQRFALWPHLGVLHRLMEAPVHVRSTSAHRGACGSRGSA